MGDDAGAAMASTRIQGPGPKKSSIPPSLELIRGATIGRYTVIRRLGAGGMGIVYLAFDPELDRRVAVKLLRARADHGSEGPTRLVREAQVMAKLSHPNVITVFDVGALDGDVFVAMEYVKGATLREWWTAVPRAPRETIAICVQAGRGLAAAHEQGILHRDFKPENVLVDEQGRARVLDFGLARASGTTGDTNRGAGEAAAPLEFDDTVVGKRPALEAPPVTLFGTVLGTPAYMSPEQLRGEPSDARSDQFSFCVAVYEALYGARPFDGQTLVALAASVDAGRVRPVPRGTRVPRAVLPALARGLAAKPGGRWPSMDALLAALEKAAASGERRRRRLLVALGAVTTIGVVALGAARQAKGPVCVGADRQLAEVWDAAAHDAVSRAFRASGSGSAGPTLERVTRALDEYSGAWVAMTTEACVATRVSGAQSDEALDLRTGCLRGRLDDVRALTDLLRHADGQLVDNAYGAVLRLRPLQACADVRALRAAYAPVDGAKADAVEAVRRDIAGVVARWNSGRCEEAMPLAASLAERARVVGYPPVEAEALLWRGRIEQSCGTPRLAAEALWRAAMDAQESHQDELLARILVQLTHLEGAELAQYDEALDIARLAEATIRRLGAPEALLADLARARGWVEYTRGNLDTALLLRKEALDRHVRAVGDSDPDALQVRAEIADLQYEAGRLPEAYEAQRDVLHRSIDLLGPRHMRTGRYTLDVAETLILQGKYDDAQPWLDRARPIIPVNVGEHLRFVEAVQRVGLGDVDGGIEALEACVRDGSARYGANDPYPLSVHADVAKWLAVHRRASAALDVARAVTRSIEASHDPDNPWYPNAYATVALLLARSGHADEALPLADRAIAVCERGAAAQLPFALQARGEALLARGDAKAAVIALDRALQLATSRGGIDPLELGDLEATLSRALAGADDARAARVAEDARRAYAASHDKPGAALALAAFAEATPGASR